MPDFTLATASYTTSRDTIFSEQSDCGLIRLRCQAQLEQFLL
jgi:hypothetical protein